MATGVNSERLTGLASASAVVGVLLVGLFALGTFHLAARAEITTVLSVSVWLLLPALVLLLTNGLPWQRYYLILHQPFAMISGLGAAYVAESLRTRPGGFRPGHTGSR